MAGKAGQTSVEMPLTMRLFPDAFTVVRSMVDTPCTSQPGRAALIVAISYLWFRV